MWRLWVALLCILSACRAGDVSPYVPGMETVVERWERAVQMSQDSEQVSSVIVFGNNVEVRVLRMMCRMMATANSFAQ